MSTVDRQALAIAVGARVPVLLWGGPGIGKTSAVREMADASGLPCEIVIASIREPSDFAGLPVVGASGDGVTLAAPNWAIRLVESSKGILFLDEVSTAPPAVQAALLRVVLERAVGDLDLPDGVAVVAAANPPDQAADGWDLAAALANRFCHLQWTIDADEWTDGLLNGFVTMKVPAFGDKELATRLLTTQSLVTAFVKARPGLLYAPPRDAATAGLAWASPRAWSMAARLLAAADLAAAGDPVRAALVAGCVSAAVAAEFLAWSRDLELPDPEAVLADPSSFRLPPRGDRAYAALASLVGAVLGDNTPARWEAAWRAIAVGVRDGKPDLAVAAVRTLVQHRPDGAQPPREVLTDLAPVLRTAGMFERLAAE
jgi:MoxR-like ATPase